MEKKATFERHATDYPGVYFRWGTHRVTGKPEKIFYIAYWQDGERIEEKAGREKQDDMTPLRASKLRGKKVDREQPPRRVQRAADQAAKKAEVSRWTIDRLWTEYVAQRYKGKATHTDKANYANHLSSFKEKEPSAIVPLDVDRLRVRLLKNHAPGTVAKVLGLLRRIILFSEKKQLCSGPGFKIQLPRVSNERTEFMTDAQTAAYIKICRGWPDPQAGNFQLLELFSGMRRGEVRNLQWSDVDFDHRFIYIRNPKGGENQVIPLSDAAQEVLSGHPQEDKSPYVFSGVRGKGPRGLKQIATTSREIRDAAGLPADFRPGHGLRHTFASHLASSGEVDLYTLQRLMTHKSPMMTARYAHLRDETLRRGADIMSRIAGKKETA